MRESLSKHVCPVLSPSSPPPVFQLNLFRIFSLYHALRESFSVCNVCIINTTRPAVTIGKPWKFKSKSRHWMRLRSLFSNLDLNLGEFTDEFGFGHRLVNNTFWHRNTTHSPRETRETKCLTNKRELHMMARTWYDHHITWCLRSGEGRVQTMKLGAYGRAAINR